ncbi:MAG: exodeoxyribonuclease V subunit gamma, partial [Candidatus Hydrogenedentes bacterium]|nr:exodeoxyribonuclease V subunit gamma [Candidatus Hydrogenedentota bacterium]
VRRLTDEGKLTDLGDAATSPGFINHILGVITQLKQAAAEPEHFRNVIGTRRRASWLDPIVAAVYEGYQEALIRSLSYDRVGIYWRAELAARETCPPRLIGIDTLILDGFEDFTLSEFRLLQALEPLVSDMLLGLDADLEEPSRQDLFETQRDTLKAVRKVWPSVEIEDLPTPPPTTFTEYLAHDIFWRQLPPSPEGLRANVEIVACPDLRQEIEYVGRRIKTLVIEQKTPLDRIAIVFRDIQSVATEVRTVFAEFGVPIRVDCPDSLEATPLAAFVLNLFEACRSWAREAVLDVIASPWFAAGAAPQAQVDLFSLLARRAGIVEGRNEWMDGLDRLHKQIRNLEDNGESSFRILPHMEEALLALRARLDTLDAIAQALPRRDTIAAYIAALEECLRRCGCGQEATVHMPPWDRERADSSWRALNAALGRVDAWYCRSGSAASIRLDEFVVVLQNALRDSELDLNELGGVACRGVDAVRSTTYDYIFLCGMNEGEFPRPPAIGAIYTDDDVSDLEEHSIQLDTKQRHASREMLAFHHVLRAAKEHLVMTWHGQTLDGRTASPSPFLADALEMLKPLGVACTTPEPPVFVPLPEMVASERDVRNAAFARSAALRDRHKIDFKHVIDALSVETARQESGGFDVYDGVLADKKLIELIAEQFGSDHEFSVNQLEMYANCPFQFFMARILNVSVEEEPDTGFDPLVRGSILHDVLQAFHREFTGLPVSDIAEGDAEAAMLLHLDEVFARRAYQSTNTPPKAAEVERARLAVLLERYLTIARDSDEAIWAPSHFEVSFGSGRGTSEDPLSTAEPFELSTRIGPVLFSGRIDRIDRHGNDTRIVDYKTSVYAQQSDIEAGVSIQLPLYALALEEHLAPDTTCTDARFVQIGAKKSLQGLYSKTVTWEERREKIREQVAALVQGIRDGRFPPTPYREMCRDCQDHRACRYESSRIDRKESSE